MDKDNKLDFAKAFCTGSVAEEVGDPRFCGGKRLLQQHASKEEGVTKDAMISILKDHTSGICMHGGFETTSSWVSEIYVGDSNNPARHWVTGTSHPCKSPFKEEKVVDSEKP